MALLFFAFEKTIVKKILYKTEKMLYNKKVPIGMVVPLTLYSNRKTFLLYKKLLSYKAKK